MGYKDQEKQKEANKETSRRYREKRKALQNGVIPVIPFVENVIPCDNIVIPSVTPEAKPVIPSVIPSEPIMRILGEIIELKRRLSEVEKISERVSNLEDEIEGLSAGSVAKLGGHHPRGDTSEGLPFSKLRQTVNTGQK